MPNRPITAIRKSKPLQQFGEAEGQAQLAGDAVHADGGEREADHHRRDGLERRLLAHADEAAERQEVDREVFRRAELQRELRDQRREQRDHDHGEQRADERRGEGRGRAPRRRVPCCAIG